MFFILYYKRERFKEEGCGSEVFFEWAIIDNQEWFCDGICVRVGILVSRVKRRNSLKVSGVGPVLRN